MISTQKKGFKKPFLNIATVTPTQKRCRVTELKNLITSCTDDNRKGDNRKGDNRNVFLKFEIGFERPITALFSKVRRFIFQSG